jgi:hypothetical protein
MSIVKNQRPGGQKGRRPKNGPTRPYTADEIARFAQYREQRAAQRPAQCTHTLPCWVDEGPPAMDGHYSCRGCQARPDILRHRWQAPP